jgi:uncharacterized membrane protein YgdD (TMEM256/DUF423 family)
MQPKSWLAVAAVSALLAVALGAFGAHALKNSLSGELFEIFEVGVRYHMYHALGLGLVALAGWVRAELAISGPAWLLLAGTVVFSGSLYLLALTDTRWLGAITPIGGTAFLAGWAWLAWSALRLP